VIGLETVNTNRIIYDSIDEYKIMEFIAVGGESIVFKGVKRSVGRTYALKFRTIDRWEDFMAYELVTLSKLEQCSTSKLAGIVPEVPDNVIDHLYNLIPENRMDECRRLGFPTAAVFCVVEDYISGLNLKEYCKGDVSKGISGLTPSINASFEQVIEFQRKLINWTIQFCEIMTHVTGDNHYLHLDVKPDNIMISAETESVTVIDFGKSVEYDEKSKTVSLEKEFGKDLGVFGTNGYAAPECCDSPEMRECLGVGTTGILDVRSDIFSFGATLWDCVNPQSNINIKPTRNGYFKRDLFNTPKGYIPEFEDIIVKCTEKNPKDRYQNYDELKKAALHANKKLLERTKPNKGIFVSGLLSAFVVVAIIATSAVYISRSKYTFEIAQENFNELAANYTENKLVEYGETAEALIKADSKNEKSYNDILEVSYKNDGKVSKDEWLKLNKCLEYTEDKEIKEKYVDTVLQNINETAIDSITNNIYSTFEHAGLECDGMKLVSAIYDKEELEDHVEAYDIAIEYKESKEYDKVVRKLCEKIAGDSNVYNKVASLKGMSAEEVVDSLTYDDGGEE